MRESVYAAYYARRRAEQIADFPDPLPDGLLDDVRHRYDDEEVPPCPVA